MITANEVHEIKKSALSHLIFLTILNAMERRIKHVAKTNRFYIKVNEGIVLKLLYRKYYEAKIETLFVQLGYKIYKKNNRVKYISWE